MMKRLRNLIQREQRGQSLVEAAVILPILLILLVGVVEVSQLAITQNRLNTAARAGTRFGANGGEDAGILQTHIWAITNTLPLEENRWDIWVFRGEVDESRQVPPDDFSLTHIYGLGKTQEFTETNTITFTNNLRIQVQDNLTFDVDNDPNADSTGVKFVGVYTLHDVETLLGLDVLPNLVGLETMSGFSVMRQAAVSAAVQQTGGCRGVFPFAVEQGVRTVTEVEYETVLYNQFSHPTGSNRPDWAEFVRQPPAGQTTSLLDGYEGMVYALDFAAFGPQSFDFLQWNEFITGASSGNVLANSLGWPGNSDDYTDHGDFPPTAPPNWPHTYRGFAEVTDSTDKQLHSGDRVRKDTISGGFGGVGVTAALNDHIVEDRTLRMVLWDHSTGDSSGLIYRASGFAVFKIVGYSTNNWLLLELVRIDNSCGRVIN